MSREATSKEIEQAEKHASRIWHKYTDGGAFIHPMWWTEYMNKLEQIVDERVTKDTIVIK